MKSVLKTKLTLIKPFLERLFEIESWIASRWVHSAHKRLMAVQWRLPPQPEHFDHQIDLFYFWLKSRNSLWLERGVYGSLTLGGGMYLNWPVVTDSMQGISTAIVQNVSSHVTLTQKRFKRQEGRTVPQMSNLSWLTSVLLCQKVLLEISFGMQRLNILRQMR